MPSVSFSKTVTTDVTDVLRPSNLRLSFVIIVPSGETTIYQVNNSSETTTQGAPLTAVEKVSMDWTKEGYEVVNGAFRYRTAAGSSDIRVIENIAKSRAEFIRITQGERK